MLSKIFYSSLPVLCEKKWFYNTRCSRIRLSTSKLCRNMPLSSKISFLGRSVIIFLSTNWYLVKVKKDFCLSQWIPSWRMSPGWEIPCPFEIKMSFSWWVEEDFLQDVASLLMSFARIYKRRDASSIEKQLPFIYNTVLKNLHGTPHLHFTSCGHR